MHRTAAPRQLPFRWGLVCLSLVVGSLLLVLLFVLYAQGYLSIEAAAWIAFGIFAGAALYETLLLSLITRHLLRGRGGGSASR